MAIKIVSKARGTEVVLSDYHEDCLGILIRSNMWIAIRGMIEKSKTGGIELSNLKSYIRGAHNIKGDARLDKALGIVSLLVNQGNEVELNKLLERK